MARALLLCPCLSKRSVSRLVVYCFHSDKQWIITWKLCLVNKDGRPRTPGMCHRCSQGEDPSWMRATLWAYFLDAQSPPRVLPSSAIQTREVKRPRRDHRDVMNTRRCYFHQLCKWALRPARMTLVRALTGAVRSIIQTSGRDGCLQACRRVTVGDRESQYAMECEGSAFSNCTGHLKKNTDCKIQNASKFASHFSVRGLQECRTALEIHRLA